MGRRNLPHCIRPEDKYHPSSTSLCVAAFMAHQHLQGMGLTDGFTPARLQIGNLGVCGLRKEEVSLSSQSIRI